MSHNPNPIILQDNDFTSSDSPFIVDVKPFFDNQNASGISVANDGKGDIVVQTSKTNGNFGDEMLLKEGDVYEIEKGSIEKIQLIHITDSSYRIVVAQADIHLLTSTRRVSKINFAIQVQRDNNDSCIQYIGKAVLGSLTSDAKWQIQRINDTAGTVITWADGSDNFNQIYDNRESLTYS